MLLAQPQVNAQCNYAILSSALCPFTYKVSAKMDSKCDVLSLRRWERNGLSIQSRELLWVLLMPVPVEALPSVIPARQRKGPVGGHHLSKLGGGRGERPEEGRCLCEERIHTVGTMMPAGTLSAKMENVEVNKPLWPLCSISVPCAVWGHRCCTMVRMGKIMNKTLRFVSKGAWFLANEFPEIVF